MTQHEVKFELEQKPPVKELGPHELQSYCMGFVNESYQGSIHKQPKEAYCCGDQSCAFHLLPITQGVPYIPRDCYHNQVTSTIARHQVSRQLPSDNMAVWAAFLQYATEYITNNFEYDEEGAKAVNNPEEN